ncbi:MAG: YolD-like family protein [Halanaerobiales bacterium]
MLKDRGNKKWVSLMLVEHKRKLKRLKQKKGEKEKPDLEEHKLEEMNYILDKAIQQNLKIKITYYRNKNCHSFKGKIKKVGNNQLLINNEKGNNLTLNPKNIIDIEIL